MLLRFWDWLLVGASVLGFVIYYFWQKNQYFKNLHLNYVKPQLIMGNMFRVFCQKQHMLDLLQNAYDAFPKDRYIGIFNFTTPVVMINDPELIKNVLVKDFDHFVDHATFPDEDLDPLTGKMMLALKDMDYVEFEIKDLYTRYTNDVIASCGFGMKTNSLKDKENIFYTMAKNFTTIIWSDIMKLFLFILSPAVMKFFKIQFGKPHVNDFFRKLVTTNMKERETHNIVRQDMIHLLMLAKQGKLHDDSLASEDGVQSDPDLSKKGKKTDWTDDDITAQVITFLFAGFESSANLLSFMTYELAINPDVQKKLQVEIDESLARTNGVVDYYEIHKLKYLDMVISETLRLWPGFVNMDRMCVKPYQFPPQNDTKKESIKLQKGDIVWVPTNSLHRDPKYFTNPNTFDPERFSDENKSSIKPFTYLPFGSGPRQCLASRFALMEVKVLAVTILSKFEFIRIKKTQVPMILMNHIFNMTAENGYWVGVRQRTF